MNQHTGASSPLKHFGWQTFFSQQIEAHALNDTPPVRVVEVLRNLIHVLGDGIDMQIPPIPDVTVGDWLLLNRDRPANSQLLERKSLLRRRAPGSDRQLQLIAANIDTIFIVTSCNHDFNIPRLERYIAMAFEADVTPVIVLTKADLCENPDPYLQATSAISDRIVAIALNATDDPVNEVLHDWIKPAQTVTFMGSSGVGKSTLVNALFGADIAATGNIREQDSKGRHTTTRKQLHLLSNGCAVLDTPGIRELQLTEANTGIARLFSDLEELTRQCKFRDCTHETEPGCAVQIALSTGEIKADRLKRWRKLMAEEAFNATSLRDRKANDKSLGKLIRRVQKHNKK